MGSKINKVNKSSLDDVDNCSDEPVHLIGTLQGFGCLIGFDKETQEIAFYSEETSRILQVDSHILQLGKWTDLKDLSSKLFSTDNWFKINHNESVLELHETIGSQKYVFNFQNTERFILAEIEALNMNDPESRFYEQTIDFVNESNRVSNLRSFADLFASLLKELTDYDRVMVYRFDKDYNGEVFAESKNKDFESFYGLHYPHTDIPVQARELYKRKQLRLLADVNAEDQNILTNIEGLKSSDIDLSMMTLRSVSPVHLQYLKNMGVTATLTISIMLDKQLWGLIACHHHSPKVLSYQKRKEALLQTQLFSSQIQRWEAYEEYQKVQEKEHIYQSILEEVMKGNDKFEAATSSAYFIGLTESDGGAVIRNGNIYSFGDTPDDSKILEIQKWMQEKNERVFLSDEFSKHTDLAFDIKDVASGVLYYSFDSSSESAMIWFRKQLSEGVLWGGRQEDSADHLTPRNSFDAWEEEVSGRSAEWHSHQIQAGLRLGSFLEKEVFITSLKEQKQQLERAADQLQSKNEELSQFNWISSHDMKEPLRKIRMFIDQIRFEEERLSDDQKNYFERLDRSAMRMQKLIADLLDYSKLSKEEAFKLESITEIIEELNDHYQSEDVPFEINLDRLPDAQIVRFQIKQLFANLMSNSIKFRKKDQLLKISIKKQQLGAREVEKYHLNKKLDYFKIIYSDNGIGFEKEYNDQIFEVFQRLHAQKKFEGTGIGLAICKKVAASHSGEIFAEGEPGKGVTFTLIIPRHQKQ